MRILLVEDDELIASGIVRGLTDLGYHVDHCVTGKQAEAALHSDQFQLLIFDLGLPDGLAIPLIHRLKQQGLVAPILVLTAWDQIERKVAALDAGADDYMVKPFDLRELEARIRVLVRRQQDRRDDVLEYAGVSMNLAQQSASYQGQDLLLTRREWLLLKEFLLNPKRILSRERLESVCYGWDGDIESNTIEVHIHHLRKKTDKNLIRNIRGMGYMLAADAEHHHGQ
jgi:two-component system OmpR family response regulator/two-component system response regulator QseB